MAETAENLCLGFGCRGKGFFAKVSGNLLFSNNTLRRFSFSSGFTRAFGKKSKGRLKTFFRRPFGFLQLGLPHIKQES